MSVSKLKDTLRPIVLKYGFEQVEKCLRTMELEGHTFRSSKRSQTSLDKGKSEKERRKGSKVTAPEYVSRMEISLEKKQIVAEIAGNFDRKSFLPTIGDIRNFCQVYGIDPPASKSRAGTIPRIFQFIAEMETEDVRNLLVDGMYSGPSRLGPIADAIRSTGKHRETARSSVPQTRTSSIQKPSTRIDQLRSDSGTIFDPGAVEHDGSTKDPERDRSENHRGP